MKSAILFYSSVGQPARKQPSAPRKPERISLNWWRRKNAGSSPRFFPAVRRRWGRKASAIQPLTIDWSLYDSVTLMAPVWAGHPAPAFNAGLALIPKGMTVNVVLCSGGGETPKSKDATIAFLKEKGSTVGFYEDVRTAAPPKA